MGDVERAELKSRQRAVLFIMMSAVLVGNAAVPFLPLAKDPDPASPRLVLGFWLLMVVLTALNLLPIGRWQGQRVHALLNDETTQAHRRSSFAAGFWVAIGCAAVLAVVATLRPLAGADVAKLVITAGLAAALASFARQELRAVR